MADITAPDDALAAGRRLLASLNRAEELTARARAATDDSVAVPVAGLAAALLGGKLLPALALGRPDAEPIHVAVFGGTNSGKSTLMNVLLGRPAAGMNPLARYSQFPEAYRPAALGDAWWEDRPTRFVGYRRYVNARPPRHSDPDIAAGRYQPSLAVLDPSALPADGLGASLGKDSLGKDSPSFTPLPPATERAVLWDTPDFSTEEARAYLRAVLDTVAVADVVLMAVTDESYADDRGMGLLRLLGESAGSLAVVVNKLPEDVGLLEDIRRKLTAALDRPTSGQTAGQGLRLLTLPRVRGVGPAERLSALLATDAAAVIRGTVAHEAGRGSELKRVALSAATDFIAGRLEEALRPLDEQARQASEWGRLVEQFTRTRLLDRHRTDYLEGREYSEFNRTLIRLMELLEVPGIGPVITAAGQIVRTPIRLVGGWLRRMVRGAAVDGGTRPPEHEVLAALIERWLADLRGEAQRQVAHTSGPTAVGWQTVVSQLDSAEFRDRLFHQFADGYADYQAHVVEELDRRARSIYEQLEQRPWLLNGLRAGNLLANAGTTILVVKSGGLTLTDAWLGPLVSGLMQVLLEAGLEQYLESQKERLKQAQAGLMANVVETSLAGPVRELYRFAETGAAGASGARPSAASPSGSDRISDPGELARRARRDWATVAEAVRGILAGAAGS